ncbi:MAG: hypothetical protein JNM17_31570 [Archangium sp.]|nr:hypothetical protein [Archangium sp.]
MTTRSETWTLTPQEPLAPNTAYVLVVGPDDRFGFTTSTERDDTPPEPRTLASFKRHTSEGCGAAETIQLNVSARVESTTTLVMMSGLDTEHVDEVPTAYLDALNPWLVDGFCGPNFPLRTTPDLAIDLRTMDFAGSLSANESASAEDCGLLELPSGSPRARRARGVRAASENLIPTPGNALRSPETRRVMRPCESRFCRRVS